MPTYAFVDGPTASPTTLFDLDAKNPFAVVEGTKVSPPSRRVSSFGSSARDGDVVAQEAYNDRVLTIRLRVELNTTAEAQATAMQTLARLLDGPQWLKWQSDGKTAPVFYRTKYGEIDVDDDMLTVKPRRNITLTITADPFAYGLEVSGSATITNDPTTGTNKMSYVMPTIQGDVLTPLRLKLQAAADLPSLVVASAAHSPSLTMPLYADYTTANGSASSGWTHSSDTLSTHIGGTAAKAVKVNPGSVTDVVCVVTPSTSAYAGDYRLFTRAAVPVGWTITNESGNSLPGYASSAVSTDATMQWRDMGVVALPTLGQPDSPWPNSDPATFTTSVTISARAPLTTSTGTVIVDAALLVPAGLVNSIDSNVALIAPVTPGASILMSSGNIKLWLDGYQSEAVTKNGVTVGPRYGSVSVITTAFAKAAPGAANVLHCFSPTSAKTATITLEWSYYPRYLYDRPATT